jgi:hypothetical protein
MLNLFVDSKGRIQTGKLSEEARAIVGEITSIVDFLANLARNRKRVLVVDRSPNPAIAHLLLQERIAYKDVLPEDDFNEIVFINNFYGVDSKKNTSESGE